MKYKPEPLDCPACHKQPEIFKRWDCVEKEWSDCWYVACSCTPDKYGADDNKVEAVASWNRMVDDFDPEYEKHRYRDEDAMQEILEDMKKFRKMIKAAPDEWCN